jgi:hypothetical protein
LGSCSSNCFLRYVYFLVLQIAFWGMFIFLFLYCI